MTPTLDKPATNNKLQEIYILASDLHPQYLVQALMIASYSPSSARRYLRLINGKKTAKVLG